MRRAALIATAVLVGSSVAAGVAQTVEGVDIGAIRARASANRADAERLAAEVERRGGALRDEAAYTRDAALARVRALDPKALRGGAAGAVDFDEIVGAAAANLGEPRGAAPLVMAFVSLSMPDKALRPIVRDVAAAGGVVVFRGFPNNSAKAFVAGLGRAVTSEAQVASIAIDPRLFRAFDIRAVPTYVVASSDFSLCDGLACRTTPPPFDAIAGNVTAGYALGAIADAGGPGARVAQVALGNLQKAVR
jgi:conjugal transfer pilus assembly protein TrbC